MRGELLYDRVVEDPGAALARGLDRELTGYVVLEPAGTVVLDETDRGILTVDDGVPIAAHHDGTGDGGPEAVANIAGRGPYRAILFESATAPDGPPGAPVAPAVPAEVLALDPHLAERTGAAADETAASPSEAPDALTAFLDNEAKIEAIQERAREEATRRAADWGLEGAIDGAPEMDSSSGDPR